MLPPLPGDPSEWSMVYVDESGIHDQSDASLEVYRRLGGPWWLLSLARFFPRWLRNPVYRVIARNRYRWFGKRGHVPPSFGGRESAIPQVTASRQGLCQWKRCLTHQLRASESGGVPSIALRASMIAVDVVACATHK